MSSKINSQPAPPGFPQAGKRNDIEMFRTTYERIVRNFDYAKTEIEDLQSKLVLKNPIATTTSNNYFSANATLDSAAFKSDFYPVGVIPNASGVITLSHSKYNYYKIANTVSSFQIEFTEWYTTDSLCWVVLEINVSDIEHTVELPNNVIDTCGMLVSPASGVIGLFHGVLKFPRVGKYHLRCETSDGGQTLIISDMTGKLSNPSGGSKLVVPQHTPAEISSLKYITRPGSVVIDSSTGALMCRTATDWHTIRVLTTYSVEPLALCETTYEGNVMYFSVVTTNIANGTELYWTTRGANITAQDFVGNITSGNVTITSGFGNIALTANIDGSVETVEQLYLDLRITSNTGTIVASTTRPVQIINV